MRDDNILLMPFYDESQSFTNGFACGIIWEMMSENKEIDNRAIQAENEEQVKLMCEHFGYDYTISGDDVWIFLTAKPINIDSLNI